MWNLKGERWDTRKAKLNKGAMRLRKWMKPTPTTKSVKQSDIAEFMGVSRMAVHFWVSGYTNPNLDHRLTIQQMTEGAVRVEDWGINYRTGEEL